MTVTSFGMGAFNLFNNIQNRNWQTRVDALIADRESLSAKISVLQEVKIESLEHKITVEEQINKVLTAALSSSVNREVFWTRPWTDG